jgi:hypothetical protein
MTQFLHNIDTNIGTIQFIMPTRINRPVELRKPYEYIVPIKRFAKHFDKINKTLKQIKEDETFQCAGIWKKSISKGVKLNIFMLGYTIGLCGDNSGVTKKQWDETTNEIQKQLTSLLGEDAKMYIEPYCDNKKFQARFQAYIMYKEMK